MNIKIFKVNYLNTKHANDIGDLLNSYAKDPMGGGKELPKEIIETIAFKLSQLPNSFSFLCYVDDEPAGLVNCFENFSTFKAKPLINIHDITVIEKFRNQGLSQMLLLEVENEAKRRGCCKITLEVLEGNERAKKSYQKFGFCGYELDPKMGQALFWEKSLN